MLFSLKLHKTTQFYAKTGIKNSCLDPSFVFGYTLVTFAEVAEQADAHDSNSCSFGSVGSIPTFGIGYFDLQSPPAVCGGRLFYTLGSFS